MTKRTTKLPTTTTSRQLTAVPARAGRRRLQQEQSPLAAPFAGIVERSRHAADSHQVWSSRDHEALVRMLSAVDALIVACYQSWALCDPPDAA